MSTPATPHHLSDSQHRTLLKVSPTSRAAQGGDPMTTQTPLHHDSCCLLVGSHRTCRFLTRLSATCPSVTNLVGLQGCSGVRRKQWGNVVDSGSRFSTISQALRDTRMVDFEPAFIAALQAVVTPSQADLVVARGVILAAVSQAAEPVRLTNFEHRWLTATGGQPPAENSTFTALPSVQPGRRLADPDPNDPHLMEVRGRHAVRRAVAQLIAEGELARGDGNQYDVQPERISVTYPGGRSSAHVFVHSPHLNDPGTNPRFMAVRPAVDQGTEVLLPVEEMLVGLDTILGPRGITLVRESRRALLRGLYLASSSLLAAASEAAWFNLARAVPSPPTPLRRNVDEGRDLAQVIAQTEQCLRGLKPSPGSARITEIVTHAHIFREVRNYALHPVEPHDGDRETWLTETGATLLAIAARRYFLKLDDFRGRLTRS